VPEGTRGPRRISELISGVALGVGAAEKKGPFNRVKKKKPPHRPWKWAVFALEELGAALAVFSTPVPSPHMPLDLRPMPGHHKNGECLGGPVFRKWRKSGPKKKSKPKGPKQRAPPDWSLPHRAPWAPQRADGGRPPPGPGLPPRNPRPDVFSPPPFGPKRPFSTPSNDSDPRIRGPATAPAT